MHSLVTALTLIACVAICARLIIPARSGHLPPLGRGLVRVVVRAGGAAAAGFNGSALGGPERDPLHTRSQQRDLDHRRRAQCSAGPRGGGRHSSKNGRSDLMARGRKRKFKPDLPAHIDQSALPRGIYWEENRWYVLVDVPGRRRPRSGRWPTPRRCCPSCTPSSKRKKVPIRSVLWNTCAGSSLSRRITKR